MLKKKYKKKILLCSEIIFMVYFFATITVSCKYTISDTIKEQNAKIKEQNFGIKSTAINKVTVDEILMEVRRIKNGAIIIDQDLLFSYIVKPELKGNVKLIVIDIEIVRDKANKENDGNPFLRIKYQLRKGKENSEHSYFNSVGDFKLWNLKT